jgi:hypothetical protein
LKQIKCIKIYFFNASSENSYVSKNPLEGPLTLRVTSRKEIAELTKAIEGALDASRGSQLQLGGLSEPADEVSCVDYHGHEVETF